MCVMPLRPSFRFAKDTALISRVDHDLGIQSTIAMFDSCLSEETRTPYVDSECLLNYSE